MDKTQKFVVWIVLTVVPMAFTPLLEIPSPSPEGGKEILRQKHNPVPLPVVACGAILVVSGVLLGGKLLLDRTIPQPGSGPPA